MALIQNMKTLLKHQLSSAYADAITAHAAFLTLKRNNDSRQIEIVSAQTVTQYTTL
jgi:hypothetical protein